MLKGIIAVTEIQIENVYMRTVSNRGTSVGITLPPGWAKSGEKVCLAVKDENTLVVSRRMMNGSKSNI